MNQLKIITNEEQYEQALIEVSDLMDQETVDADYLDVLALLIEQYQDKNIPSEPVDAIDAIKFRMDQMDFKNKDMVPYFGSKARVSEVLNRKRSLSLNMMRSLRSGLGISAETLMRESNINTLDETSDWQDYPVNEMYKNGYFNVGKYDSLKQLKEDEEIVLTSFLHTVSKERFMANAFLRSSAQSVESRSSRTMNAKALKAWSIRVFQKVYEQPLINKYDPKIFEDESFIRGLKELSPNKSGPLVAKEYLNRFGIYLIILPHLSKTYLDGAAFLAADGHPVIAMSIRFDRIDNFWFVLMHELAHVKYDLTPEKPLFFDDLETHSNIADIEKRADNEAGKWLIPDTAWDNSNVSLNKTAISVLDLAQELKIHPAIVVGRLQKEENNYRLLSKSIDKEQGQVKRLFAKEFE